MIGWNVDWGYTTLRSGSLTNISEIIITDSNRPFTIGTYYNKGELLEDNKFESRNAGVIDAPKYPVEDGQRILEQTFGNDFFTMYCGIVNVYQSGAPASTMLPSIFLSSPNLLSEKTSPGEDRYTVAIFKSLKRVLYWERDSSYSCTILELKDNGDLTYLNVKVSLSSFPAFNCVYQLFSYFFIPNYTEDTDLKDASNFKAVSSYINSLSNGFSKLGILNIAENSQWLTRYNLFFTALFGYSQTPDFGNVKPPNPFDPIPPSVPDTPGGQFDDQSDIIGDSSLPTLSASDTGFTRIYIPTLSQVKDLARYLWTDDTVIETIWNKIKQFFENPMEAIIGFNLVPVPVPSSGTKSFALMYIDTGVDMDTAANQFVDVDCGTLPIQLYYGSALDYSPYTKISCYLPYIGMVQLNTDEVVGRTLQVKYRIDIVSGSCVAKIFVDGNCIYQYSGHCAITIPIAASDFSSYVSAAISVAKLAVGAATGGAGGAAAAALNADVNQQTGSMFSVQGGSDNSGQIQLFAQGGASGPGTQAEPEIKNTQASFSGITPQNVANTVGEIMTAKPHVQHSGSFSGNSGYLGVRRPFVIIERPNLCLPENYQGLNGFPAMITMVLGECSGYTKVQQMVLSGCTATNPEQAEIMSLLKGGVIL